MKYRAIFGNNIQSLEEQVDDLLREGLELVGGVSSVTLEDGSIGFMQSMIDHSITFIEKTDKEEWIPDGKNGFYHGVYEDEGHWQVLHMSVCEEGQDCRLFKFLNREDCEADLKKGYEYTVTESEHGKFVFEPRKLEKGE